MLSRFKIAEDTNFQRLALVYLLVVGAIQLAHNHHISLWDQDEAAYAGIARTMVESGNWFAQDFMWSKIHRKPPLHVWSIAVCYRIFGVNEFSVRLPSTLAILATYLLIFFIGHKLLGAKIAFWSITVLSTSLLVPALGKIAVTDGTLLFFTTLSALSAWQVLQTRSAFWVGTFWCAFALALLTKGPPILLFSVALFFLLLFHPQRKNLTSLHPWFFLPLAALPLLAWGYVAHREGHGEMIDWMIDWYILKRVGGSVLGQSAPPGTHLLAMFVFFLPYFMFVPRALWAGIRNITRPANDDFFLCAWFISGWFLYELTPSKLPAYVVAAHVPLAILIAKSINKVDYTPPGGLLITHVTLNGLVYLAMIVAPLVLDVPVDVRIAFGGVGGVMLLSLAIATRGGIRHQDKRSVVVVALTFQMLLWVVLLPVFDQFKDSSRRIMSYLRAHANQESTVWIGHTRGHPPSLPFYLGYYFDVIKEEKDIEDLYSANQSHAASVLILNDYQQEELAALDNSIEFTEISAYLIDRNERAKYYVVQNESSRMR